MMRPYYDEAGITIYHGDARESVPWMGDVDVMVTDPPYGISWTRSANRARGSKAHDGIANDESTEVRDAVLRLWGTAPALVFGSFYAPFPALTRQVLVWQKHADAGVVGAAFGWRRDVEPVFVVGDWPRRPVQWPSVMRLGRGQCDTVKETGHPHTKPVDLMRWLVARTPPGDIFDPFMGSGSTLRAAKDVGRRAIGFEVEEQWCEVAARRCAQEVLDFGATA